MQTLQKVCAAGRVDESLFGQVAVDGEFCTQQQLDECLGIQRVSTDPPPLGKLLIERGYLTPVQVADILELQKDLQAQRDPEIPKQQYDRLFGRLAVRAGMITLEQLASGLDEQVRRRSRGEPSRLGEILVAMELMMPEQVDLVLAYQQMRILICGLCGVSYEIPTGMEASLVKCPDCAVLLRKVEDPDPSAPRPVRLAGGPSKAAERCETLPARPRFASFVCHLGVVSLTIGAVWAGTLFLLDPGPPSSPAVRQAAKAASPMRESIDRMAREGLSRWCRVEDTHLLESSEQGGATFSVCCDFIEDGIVVRREADQVIACKNQHLEVKGSLQAKGQECVFEWPKSACYPRVTALSKDPARLREWLEELDQRTERLRADGKSFASQVLLEDLRENLPLVLHVLDPKAGWLDRILFPLKVKLGHLR